MSTETEPASPASSTPGTSSGTDASAYWKSNLRLLSSLLVVWFVVSFGCGILLVEPLNAFRIGEAKLGFWFAQQGSIYTFVVLIFIYRWRMAALDREFDVEED